MLRITFIFWTQVALNSSKEPKWLCIRPYTLADLIIILEFAANITFLQTRDEPKDYIPKVLYLVAPLK